MIGAAEIENQEDRRPDALRERLRRRLDCRLAEPVGHRDANCMVELEDEGHARRANTPLSSERDSARDAAASRSRHPKRVISSMSCASSPSPSSLRERCSI